ncbi:hypothetical protein EAL2_c11090 [Peptoclostridium acidaminophilum DSM 3953]|uniref:HK97 gp10 family phage protein n=1 Tax=Peptoclostridium acidaminophilum DSM 3953 TaxID=1286171 RepID=W8TJK3_PEPAC|nr:HK97 gp10 family phage protein [Peptoclostridium acidaminophilum]AHM56407.1 hypothetical protein EAL2_c11090 [Peptoclostridium acidaminophilum DSM 3953]
MATTEFRIDGLDEFEKSLLRTVKKKAPKELEKELQRVGEKLLARAKERTPIGERQTKKSKKLINKWKLGKVKRRGDEFYIELKNVAHHAHLIENGHMTKNGGFVEGIHMLEISAKELEEELPKHLRGMLDRIMGEMLL